MQVTVTDGSSNPVSGVTVTFAVPASGASATLSSLTATTNAAGIASVTATANATVGSYSATASVVGVGTPASFSLTNIVGAPGSISATGGSTQSTIVSTGFATALQVTVRDSFGNPVPNITVTYAAPPSGATSALSSLTATTNASGVASVTATANATIGSYAVTASVPGLGTAATFNLTNTAGAAASITATGGSTQSTLVGTAFAAPLQVTVTDSGGNPVPNVTVTYAVPASGASGTLSSITATTNASGVASVTVTANTTVGSYVASATVVGVATPASFSLTNTGTAGLVLTVTSSQTTITGPGQTVTLTYTVRNTGTVAVTGLVVVDNRLPAVTCPTTALAVNATTVCTASLVTTVGDITGGGIVSVARATGTSVAGAAASADVTTRIGIDVEAIRRRSVAANKDLMMSRAQQMTSMAPNAQRLHQRLSSSLFGDDDSSDGDRAAPSPGRHEPLKAVGSPQGGVGLGGMSNFGGLFGSAVTGMPQSGVPSDGGVGVNGMPFGWDRNDMRNDATKSSVQTPFSFGGAADEGAGRINFASSLSQMRKAMEANDAAKLAADTQTARNAGVDVKLAATDPKRRQRDDIFDIWVEGQSSYFTNDRADGRRQGHASVLYAGADVVVRPGVLVGALLQRDRISESSTTLGQNRDGTGWMAGPYVGVRLTRNVFFDALYTRGSANNHVDPIGAYIDTFKTSREHATARLTGDWTHGAWRFRPALQSVLLHRAAEGIYQHARHHDPGVEGHSRHRQFRTRDQLPLRNARQVRVRAAHRLQGRMGFRQGAPIDVRWLVGGSGRAACTRRSRCELPDSWRRDHARHGRLRRAWQRGLSCMARPGVRDRADAVGHYRRPRSEQSDQLQARRPHALIRRPGSSLALQLRWPGTVQHEPDLLPWRQNRASGGNGRPPAQARATRRSGGIRSAPDSRQRPRPPPATLPAGDRRGGAGRLEDVRTICRDELASFPDNAFGNRPSEIAMIKLPRQICACIAAGDRDGVAALLHDWEAITVRNLKFEPLWEPTPFRLELSAAWT